MPQKLQIAALAPAISFCAKTRYEEAHIGHPWELEILQRSE
jgi:hypothetical protein